MDSREILYLDDLICTKMEEEIIISYATLPL